MSTMLYKYIHDGDSHQRFVQGDPGPPGPTGEPGSDGESVRILNFETFKLLIGVTCTHTGSNWTTW